jgi:hypothetical protein
MLGIRVTIVRYISDDPQRPHDPKTDTMVRSTVPACLWAGLA